MKRPTSGLVLSAAMRCGYRRLLQSQTTSMDGWQVELIPTTGSTNTERPTSQERMKRACAVIAIVNLIALL
jgi:hypothetical protein